MNEKDILKYGMILTDDEMFYFTFCPKEENYIRIRTINYNNKIFYHKMINGKNVEFKELN